jgi:hypothetical protein
MTAKPPLKWIGQRGEHDCGIAQVAIALGIEYEKAVTAVGAVIRRLQETRSIVDREERIAAQDAPGLEYREVLEQIARSQGKSFRLLLNAEDAPDDQIVKPDRIYLATVKSDYITGEHAVVIDRDGTVLDPNRPNSKLHYWNSCVIVRLNYEITDPD